MLLFNVSFTSFLTFLPHAHIPFHNIHILILTYNLIQIVIKIVVKRLFTVHPDFINCNYLSAVIVITDFFYNSRFAFVTRLRTGIQTRMRS